MASEAGSGAVVETAVGTFGIEASPHGVSRILLPGDSPVRGARGDGRSSEIAEATAAQLEEYASGRRSEFDVDIDWSGVSEEHRRVLEALVAMAPYGQTVTYGELGARADVDDPRDVGVHMNRNPFPVVVPCHRVVAADGLGGYGGGLALKRRLLELEGALPPSLDLGDV